MVKDTKPIDNKLSLAADFPNAAHDQWLKLVDKVLSGASFDKKLVSQTYDHIALQPLYTRSDWNADIDSIGLPGGAPFTRGGKLMGTSIKGWDIRQSCCNPDPITANKEILEDLEGGATSVVLNVDPKGAKGAMVQSIDDLKTILEGVHIDLAPVSLESDSLSLPIAVFLMQVIKEKGISPKTFSGNFGVDEFTNLATEGKLSTDIQTSLARMSDMAAYVAQTYPNARTFNLRSFLYHSAGAADAQEIGCALATAVEYLRAMTRAGLNINEACSQVAFTAAVDADLFLSVAKVRTFRKLWCRVAEACGADTNNRTAPIAVCTAQRMMSRRDPWVNILRTTVACFGAGIAGADSVTVLPFDTAIGLPSDLARRIARNTQIVLQEEVGLNRVIDPAGGAWMFERLTKELEQKAWSFFQEIEKNGGMANALTSGFISDKISAVQSERSKNITHRKDLITGVSEFPNIHEPQLKIPKMPIQKSLSQPVGTVGKLPLPLNGGLTKALTCAVRDGANIAALSESLWSTTNASMAALPNLRLAADFEALRDLSDAFKDEFGQRPKVFLANIGGISEFTARAQFAKNLFEAGGIEAVAGTGSTEAATIARDFKNSNSKLAVMCGIDEMYTKYALDVCTALKDAGAELIYIAGRPETQESRHLDVGIDDFIFIGCDAHAILTKAHRQLNPNDRISAHE